MQTAQRRRFLLQSAALTVAGVSFPASWAAGKIKPGERAALIVVDAPTERRAARDEKSRDEKNSDEKNTDEAGSNGDTGSAGDAA